MEDEDQNISPTEEKMDATDGIKSDRPDMERKSKNLVQATAHLKEEALRRYKIDQEEERERLKNSASQNLSDEASSSEKTNMQTDNVDKPIEPEKKGVDQQKSEVIDDKAQVKEEPTGITAEDSPNAIVAKSNNVSSSLDNKVETADTLVTDKEDVSKESESVSKDDPIETVPSDNKDLSQPLAEPTSGGTTAPPSQEAEPSLSIVEGASETLQETSKTETTPIVNPLGSEADRPEPKTTKTDQSLPLDSTAESNQEISEPETTEAQQAEKDASKSELLTEKPAESAESSAEVKPVESSADDSSTAKAVDEVKPVESAAGDSSAVKAVDEVKPVESAADDSSAVKAVDEVKLVESAADDSSAAKVVDEVKPVESSADDSSAAKVVDEVKPVELTSDESLAEVKSVDEVKPVESSAEVTAAVEMKSDEMKSTESSAEIKAVVEVKSADDKTVKSVAEPSEEKPAEEKSVENPVLSAEEKTSEKTVETGGATENPVDISVTEDKAVKPETQGEGDQAEIKKSSDDSENPEGTRTGADGDLSENVADENNDEEKELKEEIKLMPEDFYYEIDEHVSKPEITDESGLPLDLLALKHSFGYDCKRRCNLHMLDENTLLFLAGNMIQLLDLPSKQLTYIRSTSGGGIGALAVHPSRKYFAVGEKGHAPNINVFEFPSLKLFRILRGGTEQMYSSLNFSPDGDLLASQGGEPDFMLTVWNWKQEQIMLRTKAFSQEVFRVSFSSELEGQLTTAGTGHIRFWKMADTFTGLKLQGELGRFGKTEISDIEGYVELPDGKVLSGSESGNMLLWEGGLIKVEIGRKGKKLCHHGAIQQILLDEGELMTIGVDGYVRMWDFETIDTADTSDDTGLFEMEPMNELCVGSHVQLKYIVKSIDDENEATIWYAQDGNGAIYKLDLSFSHTSLAPEKISSYHAGPISTCITSPVTHLVATTGADATVRVYDYMTEKQVVDTKYTSPGTALLWAPKIVDPKGSTIYVGFEDGVLRIVNVTEPVNNSGRKQKSDCEISLRQALKPHKSQITSIAVDGKGEILATGGADSTVFFIGIGKEYSPIGFVTTPAPVTQLQFSPEKFSKSTLLVVCEGGIVVEYDIADMDKLDTAHTYHIQHLDSKQYTFKSVKSKLRHKEELERLRIEEEIRKKKEEKERQIRIERGLETESDNEEEETKEPSKPTEEWKPYIPEDPSPILQAFYSLKENQFWLSMGEFDAGYLYECKFASEADKAKLVYDEPIQALPVVDSIDVPISIIKFSNNGQQVIFGMMNGKIRIQQLDEPYDISTMAAYWMLSVHDNHYGRISGLVMSFDSTMLLSVGADGNFFSFVYMDQLKLEKEIKANKAKIPSARKDIDPDRQIDDIDDPNAYSIEDAKQKAEYDKLMKQAEEKKREVRRAIAKLRRQFKAILEQNEELPSDLQLGRMEFEMDREIKLELQRQTEEKIDTVRKELAWESEKHRIALDKLRNRFKDVVECEKIILKCFQSTHEVSSYRASKLSDDFYRMQANFERRKTTMITRDDFTRDSTRDLLAGQTRMTESSVTVGETSEDDKGAKVTTTLKGSMGERITKALQKVEEKKKKRAARRAQWSELHETKPDDNYEDPADVASIKEAKQNMGDYKLKTAQDYVVPDHLRMNVEKARGRLLVLKDLIHEHKYNFNVKFLELRDKKIKTIEEITDLVNQLEEIHIKLDASKHKAIPDVPRMHSCEQPERKLEYTRETLIKFKKEKEIDDLNKKTGGGESSGFGGGFGGLGGGDKQHTPSPPLIPKNSSLMSGMSGLSKTESSQSQLDKEITITEEVEPSPLEIQIKKMEEIKLVYEQDRLLGRIDELLKTFDAELRLLRHDKFKLDIIMKNADLRQVTLFEEFVLLKEYEIREEGLADKVSSKHQEKLDMQTKIMDVQAKLDNKKKDIEKLMEKDKKLHGEFTNSLGENNKFVDYLTKVFKKKIKRTKKKATDGGESNDDSDEDSDDESDWEESDEESESEAGGYDLDVCPSGCDQSIYDSTCQLREKRLDNDEELVEEKKNAEAMKKELEGLQKKAKVIDASLKYAQNDLEAFQLEKQQKLNELDVVVTLRLHQILHMVNGVLPQDLSQTLVFESSGVERLQHRIKELEHEKHLQKKQMKESRKKHVQLIKDRKLFEEKISEMNETCNEMMIAKFGCIVDLEKLETVVVNRGIEEMKEKLRVTEITCSEEMMDLNKLVAEKKDRITELIKDNTNRLEQLCMLSTEKKDLESSLDSRQKNLGEEYTGQRKADVHERKRLIQLVQLQAQEIDALKEEIMLLSRKGGHILPPAQPPLPLTPSNIHSLNH